MTPSNVAPSGMTDHAGAVAELARDLVRIDSRSPLSNHPVAERIEAELAGFEVERLDYRDRNGVEKRALVAHRGRKGGLALSGHMDTVPDTGWRSDPWSGRIEEGRLQGLGSTDMKGPMAAAIVAARALPGELPITLLLTTDEEITKAGAREIAQRSVLAREAAPEGIVVVEPTRMVPMRGHRVHIVFTAVASGIQAHSSTGRGRNANWDLLPFLVDMRALHERLRNDADLQDPDYDPPFSDFNLVLDNHGCGGQRHGAEGNRHHQISLQREGRSATGGGHRPRCGAPRRPRFERSAGRQAARAPRDSSPGAAVQRGFGPRTAGGRVWYRRLGASSRGALRHHGARRHRGGACSRGERVDRGARGRRSRLHAPRGAHGRAELATVTA